MITYDGEVWSYKNKYKCRKGLCKLKIRYSRNGYGYVDCVDGDKKRRYQVHRLVAYYFCEGYFDGAVVNHKDGDTKNNNYTNLEWCTQRENILKSYKTSGINQVRNYCIYYIEFPNKCISCDLKSGTEVKKYIEDNNLPIKASMLLKHRYVNGFKLLKRDNTC